MRFRFSGIVMRVTLLEKITWYVNLPLALVHELCHYLAARLFNVPVRFHQFYVTFYPSSETAAWKPVAIILAPAIAGVLQVVILLMVSAYVYFVAEAQLLGALLLGLPVFYGAWWLMMCFADLYAVYHYGRHRRWPSWIWESPETPQIGWGGLFTQSKVEQ